MSHLHLPKLDLEKKRLPNGLTVVLHRDRALPLVAVNLWYHVGSKNEAPGRTGFAHLFEHLLFQGSENVDTNGHFRLVQQAGGSANGSTWYDRTNYHCILPAHQLDLALWLESDRLGFFLPAIHQEKLDNQRDVVINERRQRVDNQPYGRAYECLYELLYPEGHPYRWPVIGYVEDLEAATLDDVRAFFETYYVPRNAVLTLAGDVPDDAHERLERYFGEIPGGREVVQPTAAAAGAAPGERRAVLGDRVELARVYTGYQVPPYGTREWYAADLLASVLTDGKASLLYEDLVYRRELAQDVSCSVTPTELVSTLTLVATVASGVEPERVEEALALHLERLRHEPPPAEHLERARNRLLMVYFHQLQTLERRADLLSHFTTFFNDPGRLLSEAVAYDELTGEDLQALVAGYLARDQRAVLTVKPERPAKATASREAA